MEPSRKGLIEIAVVVVGAVVFTAAGSRDAAVLWVLFSIPSLWFASRRLRNGEPTREGAQQEAMTVALYWPLGLLAVAVVLVAVIGLTVGFD